MPGAGSQDDTHALWLYQHPGCRTPIQSQVLQASYQDPTYHVELVKGCTPDAT